jgi:hypothetical protein
MKLKLPSGPEIFIGVYHAKPGEQRSTTVKLEIDGLTYTADCCCHPNDNFCKATGRRLAANRLLAELRACTILSADDRKAVFLKICPEFITGEAK